MTNMKEIRIIENMKAIRIIENMKEIRIITEKLNDKYERDQNKER